MTNLRCKADSADQLLCVDTVKKTNVWRDGPSAQFGRTAQPCESFVRAVHWIGEPPLVAN